MKLRDFLRNLADVFDAITALAAVGAAYFVIVSLPTVESGPAFMQIGLFGIMLPVIPYCLAGSLHRIWRRFS